MKAKTTKTTKHRPWVNIKILKNYMSVVMDKSGKIVRHHQFGTNGIYKVKILKTHGNLVDIQFGKFEYIPNLDSSMFKVLGKKAEKVELSKSYRIKFTGNNTLTIDYEGGTEKRYAVKDGQTIENVRLGEQNQFNTEQDMHFADGGIAHKVNKFWFIVDEPATMEDVPTPTQKTARVANAETRKANDLKTSSAYTAALFMVATLETQIDFVAKLGGIEKFSIDAHKSQAAVIRNMIRQYEDKGHYIMLSKALEDLGRLSDRVCHLWIACNPWLCP